MEKISRIRAVYLYAAAIIGLMFVVGSAITFINLGLKTFVFTKADMDYYSAPYVSVVEKEKVQSVRDNKGLTVEQKQTIEAMLKEYDNPSNSKDRIASQRQNEASNALAMLVVGLALYLYHWRIIQKESKK